MINVQALRHFFNCKQACCCKDTVLPHTAAQHLAVPPCALYHLSASGKHSPDGSAEALGKATGQRVGVLRQFLYINTKRNRCIKYACTVEMHGDTMRMRKSINFPHSVQRNNTAVCKCVFHADERCTRLMDIVRPNRRFNTCWDGQPVFIRDLTDVRAGKHRPHALRYGIPHLRSPRHRAGCCTSAQAGFPSFRK